MAKKVEEVELPHLGTKNDMVVRGDIVHSIGDQKFNIIAEDEDGQYFTHKNYVGNGLLDPFRHQWYKRSATSLTDEDRKKFEV